MTDLFFEDFRPGDVSTFGRHEVTAEATVAFARDYDPQPFHLDEDLARDTFVGRLIASGWHSCALQMRMMCDEWMLRSSGMGSPGIDELKWLKPVLPGDVLSVRQTILAVKPSRSRPDRGLVQFLFETLNGTGDAVMTQRTWIIFARRDAPEGENTAPPGRKPAEESASEPEGRSSGAPARDFDEVIVGHVDQLGQHLFTADDIVRFATAYDPQPFHIDAAAARTSHFGGLVASGWHTGACCMRALVDYRQKTTEACLADGVPPPRLGSSPGFTNLRWLKPVRAGDTIRYATRVSDKRALASRPGWGLVFSRNTGINQHGELVFAFDGCVFFGRRLGPN